MKILCIAQVENRDSLMKQILNQTVQPDEVFIHLDENPATTISQRRHRIAENHNILVEAAKQSKCDFIWQLEQDVELEADCLEQLIEDYKTLEEEDPNLGYVSGIQVGRHGLYSLGAWRNFTDNSFESIDFKLEGMQKVDATGFYCLLANREAWLSGQCSYTDEPYGPDVVWGLSIPYNKYVDMDLEVGHITRRGVIYPHHISTCNVKFMLNDKKEWKYETSD